MAYNSFIHVQPKNLMNKYIMVKPGQAGQRDSDERSLASSSMICSQWGTSKGKEHTPFACLEQINNRLQMFLQS